MLLMSFLVQRTVMKFKARNYKQQLNSSFSISESITVMKESKSIQDEKLWTVVVCINRKERASLQIIFHRMKSDMLMHFPSLLFPGFPSIYRIKSHINNKHIIHFFVLEMEKLFPIVRVHSEKVLRQHKNWIW